VLFKTKSIFLFKPNVKKSIWSLFSSWKS